MSDFEIIKELEKELGFELKQDNSRSSTNAYCFNDKKEVVWLNLHNNGLPEIPRKLLKLGSIERLDLSYNQIEDIAELSQLNNLEYLGLYWNQAKIPSENLIEFLKKSKKIRYLDLLGSPSSTWEIIDKELLNHNLLFSTRYWQGKESEFLISESSFFPPEAMIELGYDNPLFYYENYLTEQQQEEIVSINYHLETDPKNSEKLNKIKQNIISELLNKYYSKFKIESKLPYALRKIIIHDYQGITRLSLTDIVISSGKNRINDPHWIFFTGENGYGKTSLLQAITIGLFGREEDNRILNKHADIFLELEKGTNCYINSIVSIAIGGNEDNVIPFENLATYGPARLNKDTKRNDRGKTYSLFNSDGKLLDIEEELAAWEKAPEQKKYFHSAKNILLDLLNPQVEDIIIERKGTSTIIRYIEKDDKNPKIFSELASGYRSIIAMVGDIIIRLSENQPEIKNFNELAGIVIIDEIDLHLHPKWQKALVEKLTETFPKIQFIASTHSPIPLLGAPENTVVINVQRDEEKGITAEKLDVDFSTLTPNSILTSPIFGFEELIPVSKSKNKFVNTEDDYKKVKEKEKKRKEISEYLSPEKTDEFLNLLNDDGE
jgi:hypothetical protein